MSKEFLAAALVCLKDMDTEERLELRKALTALVGSNDKGATTTHKANGEGERVASLVNEVLATTGAPYMPLDRLMGSAKGYAQTAAMLWAFACSALPHGQRVEHLAVLRLGVRMLVANIEAQGIPATHMVVMRQLHRLPAVVDRGFPGYVRNGLMGLVVKGEHG